MNIDEINKIVIGLFFIYIVLFSSDIQLILNCGLQKMMKESIYFRHILIFISIYLFVFVLKWYNIDVIVVKDEFNNIEQEIQKEENTVNKLINSTSYLTNSFILTTPDANISTASFHNGIGVSVAIPTAHIDPSSNKNAA